MDDDEPISVQVAKIRQHQTDADQQNKADHEELMQDVRAILTRLNQREGAERLVMAVLRFFGAIGFGGLATWAAAHVAITWPDVHASVVIEPPPGPK